MKNLENMVKDPIKIFDHMNIRIWKGSEDPKIKRIISNTRKKIIAEQDRNIQYVMVLAYIMVVKEKAIGPHTDEFINYFMNKISSNYN